MINPRDLPTWINAGVGREPAKRTRQQSTKPHPNIRNSDCKPYKNGAIKSDPDDSDMKRCVRCLSCLWIVRGKIDAELLEYYRTDPLGQIKFALWLLEKTYPGTLGPQCLRLMWTPNA